MHRTIKLQNGSMRQTHTHTCMHACTHARTHTHTHTPNYIIIWFPCTQPLTELHFNTSSANILLNDAFTAKIGDCGTVREGPSSSKTSTHTRSAIGTLPYMPSEYLEDNKVSEKTDAYSFGVVCPLCFFYITVMFSY